MNLSINRAHLSIFLLMQKSPYDVRRSGFDRMILLVCVGVAMHAGLSSAAMVGRTVAAGSTAQRSASSSVALRPRYQGTQIALASAEPVDRASQDMVDKMKAREIMGYKDEERRTLKFFQLVVLPLGICFVLIMLLRGGILN